eukprot:3683102-Alexandrium_andersonii.AAC.1
MTRPSGVRRLKLGVKRAPGEDSNNMPTTWPAALPRSVKNSRWPCCENPATSKAGCPNRTTSDARNSNAARLASSRQAVAACYRSTVATQHA